MSLIDEFEIGAEDVGTPVKVKKVIVEGKEEIKIEFGYPKPPVEAWFDKESLDKFINKLEDLKTVI